MARQSMKFASDAPNVRRARVTTEPPDNTASFDPERYWSDRLEQRFSLEGVGWLGLGEPFNEWMYALRRRVFTRAVRGRFEPTATRVLDVGTGTGFYVSLWRDLGVNDITGCDLTRLAVDRLRERFPDVRFEQIDISAEKIALEGSFGAISAMDMLYHVVDDTRYARAIMNLANLLAPGGILVLTENLLHGETQRAEHQTSRTLAEVADLLRENGLEIELRRPAFVLMNTPVDSDSALLRRTWTAVSLVVGRGPRWGHAVGASLYPVEVVLSRIVREGPSTEIVVCRKAGAH
jgi:SAM-dependent methyltransferase